MRLLRLHSLVFAIVLLATVAAHAQEAGTVVGLGGKAEIGRAGTWTAAEIGATVEVGDQIRTDTPGRVRITFSDGSAVSIGDGSLFVIDEHVFNPDKRSFKSYLRLLTGKLRALVSEYYEDPTASYQIETATSVSGVRGTDFIVAYDAKEETTDVVGLSGTVEVHGKQDRKGRSVLVTSGHLTTVAMGRLPTAPRAVGAADMKRYLEGLKFIDPRASMSSGDPIITGADIPPADRPSGPSADTPVAPQRPPSASDPTRERPTTPGDAAGEPVAPIRGSGQVEVPF